MTKKTSTSVTGRDGYLVGQALCIAATWLDSLPKMHRQPSNRNDMARLIRAWDAMAMPEVHAPAIEDASGGKLKCTFLNKRERKLVDGLLASVRAHNEAHERQLAAD